MSKLEDALEDFDMDDIPEEEESMLEWWDFDDRDEMVDAVAGDIQFIIESALARAVMRCWRCPPAMKPCRCSRPWRKSRSNGNMSRSSRPMICWCRSTIRAAM
ncbi:hypothetical protein [Sphingopyxis sp. BSNA05]|uniref:hypothetical protein n=1 Tax=Sphingopyxis sp. BSNA05 TaxID=1236614 RepID=UPI0020B6DE58|nr:hypothetical protein [Sphingopyxis sp. BSNA05]